MSTPFDPYHKWLGIPPHEQPPNYYRLLGVRDFENDPDTIENGANQRMAYLRNFRSEEYVVLAQKILNEVSEARVCLLDPASKAAYDASFGVDPPVEEAPPIPPPAPAQPKVRPAPPRGPTRPGPQPSQSPGVADDSPPPLAHGLPAVGPIRKKVELPPTEDAPLLDIPPTEMLPPESVPYDSPPPDTPPVPQVETTAPVDDVDVVEPVATASPQQGSPFLRRLAQKKVWIPLALGAAALVLLVCLWPGDSPEPENRVIADPEAPTPGPSETKTPLSSALDWLVRHQLADGSWSFDHNLAQDCGGACYHAGTNAEGRNEATAVALLPFLTAGQTPRKGPWQKTIQRGIAYLQEQRQVSPRGASWYEEGGGLRAHALCCMVLCKTYAATGDSDIRSLAQLGLNYLSYAQDPTGGGWGRKERSKGNVLNTTWAIFALRSGVVAKLRVNPNTIDEAEAYLDSARRNDGAEYGPEDAPTAQQQTAAGLCSQLLLGTDPDDDALQRGADLLAQWEPSKLDVDYNFFATKVLHRLAFDDSGEEIDAASRERWDTWNSQMRDLLIYGQERKKHMAGSWYLEDIDAEDFGPGGRLYHTALCLLTHEIAM